ncbi:MAG TPA: heme-dependent oxidative N-demethylase subunit alpha family protein [Acidimicrobiales bacterium]
MGTDVWDAFDGRAHQLRMGLRALGSSAWVALPPAPELAAELDRKAALLVAGRDDVIAAVDDPAVGAAAGELAGLLGDHLAAHHGDRSRLERGTLTLLDDGRQWVTSAFDPLDLVGRVATEDWCLVRPGRPPVLAAATLCSPNRWRLAEKLGRPIADIHDPVPGYRRRLAGPVDGVLDGRPRRLWRRNWSIQSSPSRFQPRADGPEIPAVPDQVWVRSEYETLVPLPRTGWWVFGIQTTVRPLVEIAARPAVAARVHAAVATLDPETAAYKDMAPWHRALTEWLAVTAG